jgi:RNA polymerase sigma-70 factor (ECF subfamily)
MFRTDSELVRGVIDGDREAGNLFVVRFTRYVYAILLRNFRLEPELAEDLFQEVFLRLMQDDCHRLRLWRGEGDFADYLAPIVKNLALDHLRRTGHDPLRGAGSDGEFDELVGSEPGPEELAVVEERRRVVDQAVEQLGPRDRELYRRRYVEGQKHREVAEAMGMTLGHVGVALLRLEQRLERLVEQAAEEGGRPAPSGVAVRSDAPGASSE